MKNCPPASRPTICNSSVPNFRYCIPVCVRPADYHMHTPLLPSRDRGTDRKMPPAPPPSASRGNRFLRPLPHAPGQFRHLAHGFRQNSPNTSRKVSKARKDFPNSPSNCRPLEVDYLPGQEDWIRELASLYPWDYFIGSVHYVSDSWAIDDPQKLSEWKKRDAHKVLVRVFRLAHTLPRTPASLKSSATPTAKKVRHLPGNDCRRSSGNNTPKTAAKKNVAIELAPHGLRKGCREIYPSPKIVQLAKVNNVAITFGSDAHAPGEVGMNCARSLGSPGTQATRIGGFTRRTSESVAFSFGVTSQVTDCPKVGKKPAPILSQRDRL